MAEADSQSIQGLELHFVFPTTTFYQPTSSDWKIYYMFQTPLSKKIHGIDKLFFILNQYSESNFSVYHTVVLR